VSGGDDMVEVAIAILQFAVMAGEILWSEIRLMDRHSLSCDSLHGIVFKCSVR
jgi:hypothetical protein